MTARHPLVRTSLSSPAAPPGAGAPGAPASNVTAAVTIGVRLASSLDAATTGALACQLRAPSGASVAQLLLPAVALAAGEARDVFFEPAAFPQLLLQAPALWWPWQMGPPTLHALACNFTLAGGGASDAFTAAVGLREMTSEIIAPPRAPSARLFRVNGNNVLVKGGGWAPDLFLRQPADRLAAEIAYTRDMGLNAIRLEGKMNPEPFFDATDAAGLLVLPGWCCCDAWQNWAGWGPEQYLIANESTKSEALRLRGHASILMFFVSSDDVPPEAVSTMYLQALNASAWPNPTVASAGSDGVKMSGPYSWVPPVYWSVGATGDAPPLGSGVLGQGAAFGFLTEGGPGENPMQRASLAAMADNSSEALWPPRPDVSAPPPRGCRCRCRCCCCCAPHSPPSPPFPRPRTAGGTAALPRATLVTWGASPAPWRRALASTLPRMARRSSASRRRPPRSRRTARCLRRMAATSTCPRA